MRRVRGSHVARALEADSGSARRWVATEYVVGLTLERHVETHGPMLRQTATAGPTGWPASHVILSPSGPIVIDLGIVSARLDQPQR